jgi:hypothetical protein
MGGLLHVVSEHQLFGVRREIDLIGQMCDAAPDLLGLAFAHSVH